MLRYTEEPLVSFNDLFNCYSTDDLQDLYDYLSSEYEDDEFPVYRGKINNKDEMWHAMNELILPNEQQIGFDDLFNCYSLDKLKKLYDYLSSEYSDIDDLEESTKLEEAGTNKNGYTLNFGAWRTGNGISFASKNELVSFLRSNYIDLETVITYYENVTNDFKNSMHKVDNSFIKDKDAKKKFFDRGYVKIVDVKNDDLEESVKLEKLSIGNKLQAIFDKFDNNAKLIGFMLQFIDEDIIEKMYNEIVSVEESTSGIGGAYTTKAIDIKPE